ncbi:MAG: glycoside hydrolase family 31 protein [Clostridia bacterium]
MLKHLPEMLVPFDEADFARHPLIPMEGESITVRCRVDAEDGEPELFYTVSAEPERKLVPSIKKGKLRSFTLGSFCFGTHITYYLKTAKEQTPVYSFEVQKMLRFEHPLKLLKQGAQVHMVFERFVMTAKTECHCLSLQAHTGMVSGEECEAAELALPNGFMLSFTKSNFILQLKRLSQTVLQAKSYEIREKANGKITQITLNGALKVDYIWGTGERFDAVNQKGGHTNGRVVEKFTHQGEQSYLPIPFFMTEQGFGLYHKGSIPTAMNFCDGFTMTQETMGASLWEDCIFFGTPKEQLAQYIGQTGKAVLPPDWAFGIWISANGWSNDAEVNAQLEALKQYQYHAEVMVLEAWSDEMTFSRWNEDGSWKDPALTVQRIRDAGLHLLLWQIPIIKYEWNAEPSMALKEQNKEAIEQGYCVRTETGEPYRITENWFHHSLLPDFTNPETVKWWFAQRKYLLDMGVEGFKTDGGEFLFDPRAKLFNGLNGLEAHNLYPAQYIDAYHTFMAENGVNGVTFSRADTAGAQTRPMHWAGDQCSEWCELSEQLKAGLSAGLSGVLFWGFDIGGFAGELPTKELYLRATGLGCFSPIMQWHSEPRSGQFYATHEKGFHNDRSPWNLAEQLNDPEILEISIAFARLRQKLRPYLIKEARHAVEASRPLMAHLCIDFPDDEQAMACEDSYMLGRALLVAPITQCGAKEREVYLPAGNWKDYFTGEHYAGKKVYRVPCPLTRVPVFERLLSDD